MESRERLQNALKDIDYKNRLISIFQSAKDIEINKKDITDIQRVVDYYYRLESMRVAYRKFVKEAGVDFDKETAVEVGVGPIDSVFLNDQTTIVTPYKGTFSERKGKVFEGQYVVRNGDIEMLDRAQRKFEIETTPLEIAKGRLYLTQNLLTRFEYNSWLKLAKDNAIAVGVYGLKTDCDKSKKSELLREFARNVEGGASYLYGGDENGYFEVVQSKPRSR